MMSDHLPAVLTPGTWASSISTERALKQIKRLLEECACATDEAKDAIEASIDDVEVMLRCIKR